MENIKPNRNWNQRYLTLDTPWTAHKLLTDVIELIKTLYPSPQEVSILEVGCGYGLETIALAQAGYNITSLDLSEVAMLQAKKNARAENLHINFQRGDFFTQEYPPASFDLILDIALLHSLDNHAARQKFSQRVARLIKRPQGRWINVSCLSPDVFEVAKRTGVKEPPALTRDELQQSVKENFSLITQLPMPYQISRQGQLVEFPTLISVFEIV